MENSRKPVANPSVLLREEFDDWAVLFDSDTTHGFGLSPTGVYLWKLLDGERSIDDLVTALRRDATDVPEEAGEQILAFVKELVQYRLAAYHAEEFHDERERILSRTTGIAENLPGGGHEAGQFGTAMLRYERPHLEPLTLATPAEGLVGCSSGTAALSSGWCHDGTGPGSSFGYCCGTGYSASAGSEANSSCDGGSSASGGKVTACGNGTSAKYGACGTGTGIS